MDATPRLNRMALLTAVALASVIAYGSLYPFAFHPYSHPIVQLLNSARTRPVRIDAIANVILYLPFGMAIFATARPRTPQHGILVAATLGFAMSLCIELGQTFDYGRFSSLYDIASNTIGSGLGAAIAWTLGSGSRTRTVFQFRNDPFVLFLLGCWIGYWLFPYRLNFEPREYWNIFRRTVFAPPFAYLSFYNAFARWSAIALLLQALVGMGICRRIFAAFLAAALFFRVWLGPGQLTNEHLASGLLAATVWAAFLWRNPWRAHIVAVFAATAVVLDALSPFQFSSTARAFQLIPFTSFILAGESSAVYSMFAKLFAYGTLLWSTLRAGYPWFKTVAVCTSAILVLRIVQIWLPGRSAEITDALLVVFLGLFVRWVGLPQSLRIETASTRQHG